jgi:hypothetical protein
LHARATHPAALIAANPIIDTAIAIQSPATFSRSRYTTTSLRAAAPQSAPFCRKNPNRKPTGTAVSTQTRVTAAPMVRIASADAVKSAQACQ